MSHCYLPSSPCPVILRGEYAAVTLGEGQPTYFVMITFNYPSMSWPWLDNYRSAGEVWMRSHPVEGQEPTTAHVTGQGVANRLDGNSIWTRVCLWAAANPQPGRSDPKSGLDSLGLGGWLSLLTSPSLNSLLRNTHRKPQKIGKRELFLCKWPSLKCQSQIKT